MQKILKENYITSYDDMIYDSGPNTVQNFLNDKYNKVHNELYNDALMKYYDYLYDSSVTYEFLYELFTIMKNNSDTKEDLYNAIMNSTNVPKLKEALITLCVNNKVFVGIMYDIVFKYLNELKSYLVEISAIEGLNNEEDIEDFTSSYIDTSVFIMPEKSKREPDFDNDEPFDYLFKAYTFDNENDITEVHNFYMSELTDYVFILEDEYGTKIGFNRKGEWLIILAEGDKYRKEEGEEEPIKNARLVYNKLTEINKKLKDELLVEISKHFNMNHRTIEIKNSEYHLASSILIISKVSPYKRRYVNLAQWWNNKYKTNKASFEDIKISKENILDSEVIEVNYVNGKAKLYSKNIDTIFEVPFEYLNENSVISDEMTLTNTFISQS